jgi:hypothetical protein
MTAPNHGDALAEAGPNGIIVRVKLVAPKVGSEALFDGMGLAVAVDPCATSAA